MCPGPVPFRECYQSFQTYAEFKRAILSMVAAGCVAFRALACPVCRKHYGVAVKESRAVMCCGVEVVPDDVVIGSRCCHPNPDQFVDPPTVVDGGKDADSYKHNPGGQRA